MKTAPVLLIAALIFTAGIMISPRSGNTNDEKIVIFVNKNVPERKIPLADIKRIFMKERTSYGGGGKAVPINAKAGSSLRKTFAKKVLGMSESAEKIYWQNLKIKKGIMEPPGVKNTQKAVYSTAGGISYCFESEYQPSTNRIILTI